MKNFFLLALLIAGPFAIAQEITKNLGDFSTVKVYDQISVKLVASTESKIVITGAKADDVEVVTKGNTLKVKMKTLKLLQGEDITATVYYKNIDYVGAYEGAYVSSEDTFKATSFEIDAQEGAKVKLILDVQKLKSRIQTGGEIELSGKAAYHDNSITSAGRLKAKPLETQQTEIVINAGGDADITAKDLVDAQIRAGGTIDIYGSPKQVKKRTAAGGKIKLRE
ncbi:MAG: head GIN domain-containing protein [Flavobacterium sp.]